MFPVSYILSGNLLWNDSFVWAILTISYHFCNIFCLAAAFEKMCNNAFYISTSYKSYILHLTSYILHHYLLIAGQEAQIVLILDGGEHGGGQSLAAEGEEQVNISSWFSDTRSPQIHPIDLLLV